MDYIKLTPEYKEPDTKYNIISTVIFRMPHGYKNEMVYFNGLKLLSNIFTQLFPNFYLRLYYDDSVLNNTTANNSEFIANTNKYWKPLFDKMRTHNKIQLCKYEMKDFKVDDSNHNGVLGTVVRFCPFIDLEENKNINDVIISDIDFTYNNYLDITKHYKEYKKKNADLFYRTRFCYFLQDRFKVIDKYYDKQTIRYPIMAGTVIMKVKIPDSIFATFFKCLLNNNISGCERYNVFANFEYDEFHQAGKIKDKKSIKYGIDELLTLDILKYILDNKYKLLIYRTKDIDKVIYKFYIDHQNHRLSDNRFKKIVKFILDNKYDKKLSILDNYNVLDTIIYRSKNINMDYVTYLIRIKKMIRILSDKKQLEKYNINDDDLLCVREHELEENYKFD